MDSKKNIDKLNWENHEWPSDELDDMFTPSEKVWENVSKQLPIKKKRRLILPMLFFVLLSSICGYIWYDTNMLQGTLSNNPTSKILNGNDIECSLKAEKNLIDAHDTKHLPINFSPSMKSSVPSSDIMHRQGTPLQHELSVTTISSAITTNEGQYDNHDDFILISENHTQQKSINNDNASTEENSSTTSTDKIKSIDKMDNGIEELATIKSLQPYLSIDEKKIYDSIQWLSKSFSKSNTWLYGLGISLSPMAYKSPTLSDPLEGTIVESAYMNLFQSNIIINKSINNHLFLSIEPGVRYDALKTSYDLNIPYDYNTEVVVNDKKENYFSHSLPTDLGNIKTRMVVVRASNSPVQHNEEINIGFDVKYKTISLTSAIGIHYALKNGEEGLYIGARFVPQLVINRKTEVVNYESHHTYVKSEQVDITQDKNYRNLYFGTDVLMGYRLPLLRKQLIVDFNMVYHKNLVSEGRPSDIDLGISLLKSF